MIAQSTLWLRDWLEGVRSEAEAAGIPCPRPPAVPDEPSDEGQREGSSRSSTFGSACWTGFPTSPKTATMRKHARGLLAYLLDYHRREEKATWWEYFTLRDLPPDELLDERKAVAGLEFVERVNAGGTTRAGKPKGPVVDRYRYPDQEMDIERKASADDRNRGQGVCQGRRGGSRSSEPIDISKTRPKAEIHPTAAFAWDFIPAEEAKGALLRLGERVAAAGTLTAAAPSAAVELLLRKPPRLSSSSFVQGVGESELAFAIRAGANLDRSVLAIQGPPGSGKTFTGSEMIVDLVKQGKRVGVTANSHKVIRNLLNRVVEKASGERLLRSPRVTRMATMAPTMEKPKS